MIMSNINTANEKWDGVLKMRKMMKKETMTKAAGYSYLVEVGVEVENFTVEDKSHPLLLLGTTAVEAASK